MAAFLICGILILSQTITHADDIALVYDSPEAVMKSQPRLGSFIENEAVVSMDPKVALSTGIVLSRLGEPLRQGQLVRFDNELGMARFKQGAIVSNKDVQEWNKKKADALTTFLPAARSGPVEPPPRENALEQAVPSSPDIAASTEPFIIRVNDMSVGDQPLRLPVKRKQSKIKLDVILVSTAPVWYLSVKLESEPYLLFWQKGKKTDLNNVPSREFKYDYQTFFKPFSPDKPLSVSVEAHKIQQPSYVWTFEVKTKTWAARKKVRVEFY